MKKIFILLLFVFFLVGCNNTPQGKEEPMEVYLERLEDSYTIFKDEEINFKELMGSFEGQLEISSVDTCVSIENCVVKGIEKGEASLFIQLNQEEKYVTIIVNEKISLTISDVDLYIEEMKKLDIKIKNADNSDLVLEADNDNIKIINNQFVQGIKPGVTKVKATLDTEVIEFMVTVKEYEIEVLNDNFEVSIFETLALKLKYPAVCQDKIEIIIKNEEIIKIEENIIYPLKEGSTRVKVQIKGYEDYSTSFTVTVKVDPLEVIKMIHNEEALMLKEISLYGASTHKQQFLGSVSRYMYADLNLKKNIIDIYDNPYVGKTATPEIVEALDRKGYPRSGVLMESISYITYHDTGNSNAGANAQGNANWMTNQYSVSTSARSWHYTVDENEVIQSIPDNEITWQGDNYDAYTKSIGIETCVNAGANMDKIWHRMGKLCAQLLTKYNLSISDIKQHYDWSQKNCPQTLRRNGLYPYAISLVEGELLVRKYLLGYEISFESLNPEYLDNTGQIIKVPSEEITVGYTVTIKNSKGYNESITLYTKVGPLK